MPNHISLFASFTPYQERLLALGMETLEQIEAAATVAGPELRQFLGADVTALLANTAATLESIPADAMQRIVGAEYGLGVELDQIPSPSVAPQFSIVPNPPTGCANLVSQMPPIQNQGSRNTCVAFSSLAVMEHWLASNNNGSAPFMSEQFQYWNCKRSDGSPTTSGTYLGVSFPLLKRDGCCEAADWAYDPNPIPGNEGQGPAPAGTQLKALSYRVPTVHSIAATSVTDIRNELLGGRAVSFSIPVFNSWYRSTAVAYSGDITMPIPGEARVGGHAMCFVGCVDLPDQPAIGGGRFILRNSWGTNWGINSSYGAGYGTIPYAYIARFGAEAYSIG